MYFFGRNKGEKFEIPNTALFRVAKIQPERVLLEITAPFNQVERCKGRPLTGKGTSIFLSLVGIRELVTRKPGVKAPLRASIGVECPEGLTPKRYELIVQYVKEKDRFPWFRYPSSTKRIWISLSEELVIR